MKNGIRKEERDSPMWKCSYYNRVLLQEHLRTSEYFHPHLDYRHRSNIFQL
jgi:hypothetical protein